MYHITTLSPFGDLLAVDLGVGRWRCAGSGTPATPSAGSPRPPASSCVSGSSRSGAYWSGFCISAHMPHAGRVAGRLVAGDRQQQHEHVELELGQLVAVDLGVDQLGDDVVARVGLALLGQLVDVHVELGRRPSCAPSVPPSYSGSSAPIIAFDHSKSSVPVLLGHAHDLGDRLQRQLGGEVDDEVARAALDHVVDDQASTGAQVLLEQADHARGEALVDQQAVAGVLGRIGVAASSARGSSKPPCDSSGSHDADAADLRRVQLGVAVDGDDVVVLHDVPEARCRRGSSCHDDRAPRRAAA